MHSAAHMFAALKEMLTTEATNSKTNAGPPPLLKDSATEEEEDNLTPAQIRNQLEDHFIELWGESSLHLTSRTSHSIAVYEGYAQSDADKELPWEDVAGDPSTFILVSFLPPTIPFDRPRNIDRTQLHPVREMILSHQEKHPLDPFILFADTSSSREPTAATLDEAEHRIDTIEKDTVDALPEETNIEPEDNTPMTPGTTSTPQVAIKSPACEVGHGDDGGEVIDSADETSDDDRRIADPNSGSYKHVFMPFQGMTALV